MKQRLTAFAVVAATMGAVVPARADVLPMDSLGEACTASTDCTSDLCAAPMNGAAAVCTQACSTSSPCPGGYGCSQGYCFATGSFHAIDAGSDAGSDAAFGNAECDALVACCGQLPSALQSECTATVVAENGNECTTTLAAFKTEGYCSGFSSGTGAASTSATSIVQRGDSTVATSASSASSASSAGGGSSGGCATSRSGSGGTDGLLVFAVGALGLMAVRRRRD